MIYIGNHVSVTDGYEAMGKHELSLGGDTFAFFPRNPRGGRSKPVRDGDIAALCTLLTDEKFGPLVVHGAYTMNLCSAKEDVRANSLEMITDDLIRLQQLPGNLYNFHPGSHTGQGTETGIVQIAGNLVKSIQKTEESTGRELANTILLETMTGKGSEMGGSFEEIRAIIDAAAEAAEQYQADSFAGAALHGMSPGEYIISKLGVCLDTCHVWDAGYDIVNDPDGVLQEFDRIIGLPRLKAIHINDSKNTCGAKKDRHEKLGEGLIGAEALKRIVQHPVLQGLPFILETPNEDEGYRREIQTIREWML